VMEQGRLLVRDAVERSTDCMRRMNQGTEARPTDRSKRLCASEWTACLRIAALLLSWGLAFPASAEEEVIREPDRTIVKKRTVIDFSDVAVEGELVKPEGSYSVSKRKTTFKTLIQVRDNFAPELRRSAENP
jgi:hypothetical protein